MKPFDVTQLVPQREPILMLDALTDVQGDEAHTCYTVPADTPFLDEAGRLEACGLIEHMAQSASAFAGYRARMEGAVSPPVGYIGEVKNFRCHRLPQVGDELHTTICLLSEVGGVTLLSGETRTEGVLLAQTQMKIFMQPDRAGGDA